MTEGVEILKGVTYALVLGRGGSKGLPGKNVRVLGGQPLIAWSVAAGLTAKTVSRTICSTDCQEIARAAANAGCEVPFIRPQELATDRATDLDVFTHAVNWLANNEKKLPEYIVQLRPTTPFRPYDLVDKAVALIRESTETSCVRSIALSPITPYKMWLCDKNGDLAPFAKLEGIKEAYNMPRQVLPPVYWHTGQIDVIRTDVILNGSMTGTKIRGIEVNIETSIDIDTISDFILAEIAYEEKMPEEFKNFLFNK